MADICDGVVSLRIDKGEESHNLTTVDARVGGLHNYMKTYSAKVFMWLNMQLSAAIWYRMDHKQRDTHQ